MSSTPPEGYPTPAERGIPETSIHESRLAPSPESYKAPENHIFRKAYRQLSDAEKREMDVLKDKAFSLYQTIDAQGGADCPPEKARYIALAKTNLEISVMLAVKAITG